MKLIFICNYCQAEFEPRTMYLENSYKNSRYIVCPYCASTDTQLTEQSKIILDRKEKIDKINDKKGRNNKNN